MRPVPMPRPASTVVPGSLGQLDSGGHCVDSIVTERASGYPKGWRALISEGWDEELNAKEGASDRRLDGHRVRDSLFPARLLTVRRWGYEPTHSMGATASGRATSGDTKATDESAQRAPRVVIFFDAGQLPTSWEGGSGGTRVVMVCDRTSVESYPSATEQRSASASSSSRRARVSIGTRDSDRCDRVLACRRRD